MIYKIFAIYLNIKIFIHELFMSRFRIVHKFYINFTAM
jgi:hypothetical protein